MTETTTIRTQWEPPVPTGELQGIVPSSSPPPAASRHVKRRQYAAGQTQAYYGADSGLGGGVGGGYAAPVSQVQQPSKLFTPGLAAENQSQQQQQHVQPGQPQPPYYGGGQPEPEYFNGPQQVGYGQPQKLQMGAVADQFGQMNMGRKGLRLYTSNFLTSPPDPRELHNPSPEIVLPPNSCISPNPSADADASYQRCHINAIPTNNSLLKKASIPFGLVQTPYSSVKEGNEPVPVVTDTVVARCRRCRASSSSLLMAVIGE